MNPNELDPRLLTLHTAGSLGLLLPILIWPIFVFTAVQLGYSLDDLPGTADRLGLTIAGPCFLLASVSIPSCISSDPLAVGF